MSIEQRKLREGPMSPSPSPSTSTSSDLTQAPSFDTLPDRCISPQVAKELNARYNRRTIPIMSDEQFIQILNLIAKENEPNTIETKLRLYMEGKNTSIHDEYVAAKYDIGLAAPDLFQSASQQFRFVSALREHTVHNFEGFVADCLPALVHSCLKNKRKQRQQKRQSPMPKSCRRSTRIAKQREGVRATTPRKTEPQDSEQQQALYPTTPLWVIQADQDMPLRNRLQRWVVVDNMADFSTSYGR
ncbi:hypothetical protein BDZ45DRAFT_811258 [Acephala macrosclerotiorum]|nr:hypothetical protein BDZ45DRAFT_811258 [Acephala macrosclerotiorum]